MASRSSGRRRRRAAASTELNMTSMIDILFQLIIFFMLVNQITAEELVDMVVPELDNPKSRPLEEENRVVVNVVPQAYAPDRQVGDLDVPGEPVLIKVGMEPFAVDDTEGVTRALEEAKARNPNVQVLLRADAGLYYGAVQPVMRAITEAGIVTVNLVAYLPEDQR